MRCLRLATIIHVKSSIPSPFGGRQYILLIPSRRTMCAMQTRMLCMCDVQFIVRTVAHDDYWSVFCVFAFSVRSALASVRLEKCLRILWDPRIPRLPLWLMYKPTRLSNPWFLSQWPKRSRLQWRNSSTLKQKFLSPLSNSMVWLVQQCGLACIMHGILLISHLVYFVQVVMKIIKHSRETPGTAAGLLVGLDLDGTLEVSNSFGLPVSADNDEKIIKTSGLCTYCIYLYSG